MSCNEDRAARQDRMLDELDDLAMDLARDMAAEAKAAETLEERERCVFAFDRMYRAVRLSVALSRRLKRDEAREQAHHRIEAIDLRKARLRARLRSEIRSGDYGFKQSLDLERDLDERIAEDALYQTFLDLPLDAAIAKVRDDLGLDPPDPPPGRSPIEGEVDRTARCETEGVEAHSDLRGLQPPQSAALTAPPEGEHLGGANLKPAPS